MSFTKSEPETSFAYTQPTLVVPITFWDITSRNYLIRCKIIWDMNKTPSLFAISHHIKCRLLALYILMMVAISIYTFATITKIDESLTGENLDFCGQPLIANCSPNSRNGNPGLGVTKQKSILNSMLVNKDFLTWLLIGWRLCCQPIRYQVWKSLLTNMDFNREIS